MKTNIASSVRSALVGVGIATVPLGLASAATVTVGGVELTMTAGDVSVDGEAGVPWESVVITSTGDVNIITADTSASDGSDDGSSDGSDGGSSDGSDDGSSDGSDDGSSDGSDDGSSDGSTLACHEFPSGSTTKTVTSDYSAGRTVTAWKVGAPDKGEFYDTPAQEVQAFQIEVDEGTNSISTKSTTYGEGWRTTWISECPGGEPVNATRLSDVGKSSSGFTYTGVDGGESGDELTIGKRYYFNIVHAYPETNSETTCPGNECTFVYSHYY